MRAPRQPLLFATLAFAGGIWLGTYVWRPASWWLVAFAVFSTAATLSCKSRRWLAATFCLGALVFLGALSIQIKHPVLGLSPQILPFADGHEVTVIAHVTENGVVREGGYGRREVVEVETESICSAGATHDLRGKIRMTFYSRSDPKTNEASHAGMPGFIYGQRLRFIAKLRPPRNFGNPGAFDYRSYLAAHGVIALGSASLESVEVLPGFVGDRFDLWRNQIRHSLLDRVHALWPERQAGLMDAMVIGDDAFLNRDIRTDFQRSGTYHVLVVSGMNLSILAFVVFWLLRRLRVSEVVASLLTVLLSFGYAYVCDWGAPIVRSALMLTIFLAARLLYRDRAALNVVGTAALAILAIDPTALFDPSFQLTFLSVLTILGIGVPLLERTSQLYRTALRSLDDTGYDRSFLPKLAQFRLDLRMICGRLARLFGEWFSTRVVLLLARLALAAYDVMFISALMQVALAMPMVWYFHRATTLALPANVLVVPLAEVLMPAAVAAVGLSYISLWLARLPALVAGLALDGITHSVYFLGHFRLADLRVPTPDAIVALAAGLALAFSLLTARRRTLFAAAGLGTLAGSAIWLTLIPPHPHVRPGALEITAIDVGQGDSTLIVSPDGKTLLVDAGGPIGPWRSEFDYGEDVVSPYLWARGFSRLDAIALSHGHSDHISGLPAVVANFNPNELWLGPNPETRLLDKLLKVAREHDVSTIHRTGGDVFEFGKVKVQVLSPPLSWQTSSEPKNDDSIAMRFTYGNTSALMEGDAGRKMERDIARQHPRAELLKVAHNGSTTSTTPELLAAVRPRYAVISVGFRNPFHHPRPEVLDRLQSLHVATYRTDLNGAVTFYLDGTSVTAQTRILP